MIEILKSILSGFASVPPFFLFVMVAAVVAVVVNIIRLKIKGF